MDQFSAHWEDVNTALGGVAATDLKLQGGYTRAMFVADRNAIDAAIVGLVGLENVREIAAANRDSKRLAIAGRLSQFRNIIRALLPKTAYATAMPTVPPISIAESKFLTAFDDMANLWAKINADSTIAGFTPPLVIAGYTLATFVTDLAAMRTTFGALTVAENDEHIARENRDVLLPAARERMVQYRAAVEAIFGPTHALTVSRPDVYPQPGSTPDAVTLSGVWNEQLSAATLTWTASNNPNLVEYELRVSPGPTFGGAVTVAGNAPPGTLALSTASGLFNPGDVATFKVFVLLTTGNEAGSNPVTITRPVGPVPPP